MSTVTLPKDSRVTLDWLQRACAQNPVSKIMDPATGQWTGNFTTGPVRLSWTDQLFKARKDDSGNEKFSVTPLFPPGVDISELVVASNAAAAAGFPQNMTSQGFQWAGLQSPWHDQLEKASKYRGYTSGAWYFNCGTQFKPRIVDPNMNDIVDEKRVYPGVWAILAVNAYHYGSRAVPGRPTKKGVSFGLQSTVIIGDDDVLGGAGIDPKKAFAGINIQSSVNIGAAFNGGPIMPPVAPNNGSGPASLEDMRRLGLI